MDNPDSSATDIVTISDATALTQGAVTVTTRPTFPPPHPFGDSLPIPKINYSVLNDLSKRDIDVEGRGYTVVYEERSFSDGRFFGFREKSSPIEHTNLFQILPSSKYGLSAIDPILRRIDFSDEKTVKQLIAEGEKVMKHSKGVENKPVPLNDLMGYITINGYEYVITYQTPESSKHIKSALQESLARLSRSIKSKQT